MDVVRSMDGIVISQQKYVLDLLKEIGNLRFGLVETPMGPNPGEDHSEEISLIGKVMYRMLVGKLIYLSHTRSYIIFYKHC